MNIAYFGLPLGAHLLLRDGHRLDPCVLSPLDAPGRRRVRAGIGEGQLIDAWHADKAAIHAEIAAALARARPELLVSWFWTRLLPGEWLSAARLGGIGVHPSLLPRHRGPNPFFWAIDAGDERTGVTLHTLAPEYDTGTVLLQRELAIGEQNAWQLARALDRPSLSLLREGVGRFAGSHPPTPSAQDDRAATWAPEPTGRELSVDWTWTTARVLRRIRALSPVPGLAVEVGELRFFITEAGEAERYVAALLPGEAAVVDDGTTLVIRTADGAIAVERAVLDDDDDDDDDTEPKVLTRAALAGVLSAHLKH